MFVVPLAHDLSRLTAFDPDEQRLRFTHLFPTFFFLFGNPSLEAQQGQCLGLPVPDLPDPTNLPLNM